MKTLYTLILFFMACTAYGQSNLPACKGSDAYRWSNCFGTLNWPSGEKYVGDWKDGKRNGQGSNTFANGDKYVGKWKDDKPNIQGTYSYAAGDKYVGEYKDGNRHGQGTFTHAKGDKYVGKFKDGAYSGQGTFTWADGSEYFGDWKESKKHGQGVFTTVTGDKYVGEFKDDKPNGQGIEYSATGSIQDSGIYRDGVLVASQHIDPNSFTRILLSDTSNAVSDTQSNLPACKGSDATKWSNCFGIKIDSSGNKYAGEWKDGRYRGQGAYYFLTDSEFNGDKYVGEFFDNAYNGQGSYSYSSGDKHIGEYKNNAPNGQGTYTWANGNKYVGEFKKWMKSGQGTFVFTDGRIWLGEWDEDKANGRLIQYSPNGTIEESGIYKDNALVSPKYIDPNSFTRISLNVNSTVVSNVQSNLPACKGSDEKKWSNCFGTLTFSSGEKYVGEFKDGKRSGQGTNTWADGETYVGEWKDGKLNGQATYIWSTGDKYVGGYKDNKRNGQGTFFYLAENKFKGDKYVGEFKDGNFHGQGTYSHANGNKYVGEYKDDNINGQGVYIFADGDKYVGNWKDGKLNGLAIIYDANGNIEESGIYRDGNLVTSQRIDPASFTRIAKIHSLPAVTDAQLQEAEQTKAQLELERQRLAEERRRLDAEKRQRELAKQSSRISITATASQPDSNGVVTIKIQTDTDTSSLKINGDELGGKTDGNYVVKRVARVGQETKFVLAATDIYGNTDAKTITVSRTIVESKVTYPELNPERIKRQPERDAVAVIIGISNYKNLPKADFAKDDAQVFFDYAIRALGVRPGNIKLLMDEQADAEEIYTAFKTWLPARVKSTTDVYVFYSGHGLPTQDGSGLYWLPQRANRDVISKTAILLQDINSDIQASKPKSVTIFMDACYSGQARGGETLVASARPIALKSQPATFPSNFTVISASQADQISSSSPDLQHGIFSYYLMKGMEGDADLNKDGKITLDEIQAYLSENVGRHARIMNRQQEPQVMGDGGRVLVGR